MHKSSFQHHQFSPLVVFTEVNRAHLKYGSTEEHNGEVTDIFHMFLQSTVIPSRSPLVETEEVAMKRKGYFDGCHSQNKTEWHLNGAAWERKERAGLWDSHVSHSMERGREGAEREER